MNTPRLLGAFMAGALLLAAGPAAHGQNLLGGTAFDTGADLTPWEGGPSVYFDGGTAFFIGSPGSQATISQTVSTTAGAEHTLNFKYAKGGDYYRITSINAVVYLASDLTTPIAQTGYLNPGSSPPGTDHTDFFPASLTFTPAEGAIVVKFIAQQYATRVFPMLQEVSLTASVVDTDGDGYPDGDDAFPNDPTEWADTDGDGVGDNGDAFPLDPTESVDTDGDGVGDNADACDTSDLSLTVVIGGQDTFVFNELFEDGCTITDLIVGLASSAGNHGAFVSGVAHLTNDLKSRGVITNKEKAAIQKAAAQSGK